MSAPASSNILVIEAGRSERHYWHDLWRYRELLYFLARRDVSVRYKQTAFGVAWAVVKPLATMLVFTLVFGRIAKLPSEGVPYSLMVFTGMLPWFFFSGALNDCSNSLVVNGNLLAKVYFPRLLVPLSAATAALVDLAIGFGLLVLMMAWLGYPPSARLFVLPLFILLTFAAALGAGLWFAALNVKYRDLQFVVPFLLQFGLYASPIAFSSTVIPESWRPIYSLNPMVGVIEGFRWALIGGNFGLRADALLISVTLTALMVAGGILFFRRTERSFADVI